MEYWREKHNIKHHAHPNVVNVDPDIHSWPFTFSQEEYKTSGPVRRFFQRHLQGWTFWPISLLVGHLMRFATAKELSPADSIRIDEIMEKTKNKNFTIRSLIREVILTESFRNS